MEPRLLAKFGCLHKTLHGNGNHTLTRILATCEEMLHDRGFSDAQREVDWQDRIGRGEAVIECPEDDGGVAVKVYVHTEEKVGVKFVRSLLEQTKVKRFIVISLEGPTPFTRKECDDKPIQFFTASQLCVNITHHKLVPKHEKVDCLPAGISKEHLPLILDTDPVVQYYDWPVGSVVRVMRKFGGHEPIPYFRMVVSLATT